MSSSSPYSFSFLCFLLSHGRSFAAAAMGSSLGAPCSHRPGVACSYGATVPCCSAMPYYSSLLDATCCTPAPQLDHDSPASRPAAAPSSTAHWWCGPLLLCVWTLLAVAFVLARRRRGLLLLPDAAALRRRELLLFRARSWQQPWSLQGGGPVPARQMPCP